MWFGIEREGAAALVTAIALRFGRMEAALDAVFVVPTVGTNWIAHALILTLLS